MDIEIRKLSSDILDDWLYFFDNVAFSDNGEWQGCYCMCYHWNKELQEKKEWGCSKEDAPFNREAAIEFIKAGRMQGYLAYADGTVAGWCNTNDKKAYDNVFYVFPVDEDEAGKKVKCIACFCIAPGFRGKGVATRLLEKICADAADDGYDFIEAYPFVNDANHAYHGPQALYEKSGFIRHRELHGCNIMRRYLK